jgi:alcohol dehydrogenase, propanol-preferring
MRRARPEPGDRGLRRRRPRRLRGPVRQNPRQRGEGRRPRGDAKLAIGTSFGADHVINVKGKSANDVGTELNPATGQAQLDAIIDCVGAPEMIQLGFSLLSISGHYADVGLVGDRIDIPLFPRVSREQTFHGSFWGNYTDLSEVVALAAEGQIRHTIKPITFDQLNENIELLRRGEIVGRAVMTF